MDLVLHTDASCRNDLDTGKFARMLDDPSQCYKFYWLEAILNLLPVYDAAKLQGYGLWRYSDYVVIR